MTTFENLMANAQNMPNIPEVVQELIQSFNADHVDTDEITSKLSRDQVLSAKVLRMANSSRYGGHRQISSINESVVLLGFNALRTLVLASGLSNAFKAPDEFDMKAFWQNSFIIAEMAKWISQFTDVDNETAYTCGMLANIGELLIHVTEPQTAVKIDQLVEKGADRAELEIDELGISFSAAGGELAKRWKFPMDICDGIFYQINPKESGEFKPLAGLVYLANYIHVMNQSDNYEGMYASFPKEVAQALNIPLADFLTRLDETKELEHGMDELL